MAHRNKDQVDSVLDHISSLFDDNHTQIFEFIADPDAGLPSQFSASQAQFFIAHHLLSPDLDF